jgi:hypothetical protein
MAHEIPVTRSPHGTYPLYCPDVLSDTKRMLFGEGCFLRQACYSLKELRIQGPALTVDSSSVLCRSCRTCVGSFIAEQLRKPPGRAAALAAAGAVWRWYMEQASTSHTRPTHALGTGSHPFAYTAYACMQDSGSSGGLRRQGFLPKGQVLLLAISDGQSRNQNRLYRPDPELAAADITGVWWRRC